MTQHTDFASWTNDARSTGRRPNRSCPVIDDASLQRCSEVSGKRDEPRAIAPFCYAIRRSFTCRSRRSFHGRALPKTALKVSLQTELQVLDPIITTINATRVFAYLVFDQLVAIDSEGHYKPQMLAGWDVSPDRLTYTFHLRDGLKFSDGAPVTSEDCIASIERWAKREGFGAQLMDAADHFQCRSIPRPSS